MRIKKYLVCFGNKPWDALPDRTQYFMSNMKEFEIFYFFPPTESYQFPTERSRVKVMSHVRAYALPKTFTKSSSSIWSDLKEQRLKQYVARVLRSCRVRSPLIWCTHPLHLGLMENLSYSRLIYDCATFWEPTLLEIQQNLLRKADLVLASSPGLKGALQEYHKNVVLLPNGVDYPLYEDKARFLEEYSGEKFFGFSGMMDGDLDLSTLIYVAKKRPMWKFCLMGECAWENPFLEELLELPNVAFCGNRPPEEEADFLLSCTVLMEFRSYNSNSEVQSSRILEYFSTGRPIVVSIWQNEVERFPDVMYNAFGEEDFLTQCEIALNEQPQMVSERRRSYGKMASWKKRTLRVMKIFKTAGF